MFLSELRASLPTVGLWHALLGYAAPEAFRRAFIELVLLSAAASANKAGERWHLREIVDESVLQPPSERWEWPVEMITRRMVQPQWRQRAEAVRSRPLLLFKSPNVGVFSWQPTWRDLGIIRRLPQSQHYYSLPRRAAEDLPDSPGYKPPAFENSGSSSSSSSSTSEVAYKFLAVAVVILRPNRYIWLDQTPYAESLGEFRRIAAHYGGCTEAEVLVRRLVVPPGRADARALSALRALFGGVLGTPEGIDGWLPQFDAPRFADENFAQAIHLQSELNFHFAPSPEVGANEDGPSPPRFGRVNGTVTVNDFPLDVTKEREEQAAGTSSAGGTADGIVITGGGGDVGSGGKSAKEFASGAPDAAWAKLLARAGRRAQVFQHTVRSGLARSAVSSHDTLAEVGGEWPRHAEALHSMAPQGGLPLDGGPSRGYWKAS